jgi:hypothetical protein
LHPARPRRASVAASHRHRSPVPFAHQFGSFHQASNDGLSQRRPVEDQPLGGATYVKRPGPGQAPAARPTRVNRRAAPPVSATTSSPTPHGTPASRPRPRYCRAPQLEVRPLSIGEPKGTL